MIASFVALADVDAAYGRLNGDVAIAASAGMAAGATTPRFDGDLRLRYLQTAGLFGTVEAGDGSLLATGIELRPLFVSRWALGNELGNPPLDMLIDSAALELGVAFLHPGGGRALQASVGLELPLFPTATGPFVGVHAGARWNEDALAGNGAAAGFVAISLGWQQIFTGHVVDYEEHR
jgi:hypothetical protein